MDLFEAIQSRHSVRTFAEREVEEEKLLKVLDCARLAPSSTNSQPWRFVVVKGKEREKVLSAQAPFNAWMGTAPVFVVIAADTGVKKSSREGWHLIDIGLCAENLLLAAHGLGLGACPVAGYSEDKLRQNLGLEEKYRVPLVVALGYPAEGKKSLTEQVIKLIMKGKKPLDELMLK